MPRPSEELLGEVGDGQAEQGADHPLEQQQIGLDGGEFDLQVVFL